MVGGSVLHQEAAILRSRSRGSASDVSPNPKSIRDAIPQVGLQELILYPPADSLYDHLRRKREVTRLVSLRHLGALSHAFPGARHTRWDYAVAMLYFSEKLRVPGMNSIFRIGSVRFSSSIAALQALSLVWNIGHVPGTFSVEKGIYRFLHRQNSADPAASLRWGFLGNSRVRALQEASSKVLLERDYLGMARVLAAVKLLSFADSEADDVFALAADFACPFLVESDTSASTQWVKLETAFRLVRHLAYLTIDAPYTGHGWALPVSDLLSHLLASKSPDLSQLDATVSEVLSPIERATYETIYHSPEARRECALVAEMVESHLSSHPDPVSEIHRWLGLSLFNDLKLGRRPDPRKYASLGTCRLRSHFTVFPQSPVGLEQHLKELGFSHPVALVYPSWNTDVLLEPDESILDVVSPLPHTVNLLGKLILWHVSYVDDLTSGLDDPVTLFVKFDLEASYVSLLDRAIRIRLPGTSLRVRPWRLKDFGLFPDDSIPEKKGCVWASTPRLDDPIVTHILRDRSGRVPSALRNQYEELKGIRALRLTLRRSWTQRELRQRWLVLTASTELVGASGTIIEFDGALVRISTRSGGMRLYGLESKKGSENPYLSLAKRLRKASIPATCFKLGTHHAFAEIAL